jgi:hypothetical protein
MSSITRGCLLLRRTWSHLGIFRGSVVPHTRFGNCLMDYDCVWLIVNFALLYLQRNLVYDEFEIVFDDGLLFCGLQASCWTYRYAYKPNNGVIFHFIYHTVLNKHNHYTNLTTFSELLFYHNNKCLTLKGWLWILSKRKQFCQYNTQAQMKLFLHGKPIQCQFGSYNYYSTKFA